ncbi:zinc-ribbon domain-containing protein [candidate division WOR-3 bacterium]|uniref:Zinc-ribbon domain-containing protein n=1 Tax=candidate division WOR-3 bacterium TaxID=2052148 RepID=A0A9D5KCZ2_UNCW3|nr:zinc-ribbon domain-containing protein [candidate division WOR-3 bacterium]MBD3365346.1 zinc-ribbon domain-containing protein [candidate division WOR-3 bacterium]
MIERCPRCGWEMEKKGKFCPRCGQALAEDAVRAVPQTYHPQYPYPERPKQTYSMVGFGLALGGLIIWLLTIPGLIFGILGLKQEPAGRSYAKAAIWISSVLIALPILVILAALIVAMVAANYYA